MKTKKCLQCGKKLDRKQKDFCSRECCIAWVRSLRKAEMRYKVK